MAGPTGACAARLPVHQAGQEGWEAFLVEGLETIKFWNCSDGDIHDDCEGDNDNVGDKRPPQRVAPLRCRV